MLRVARRIGPIEGSLEVGTPPGSVVVAAGDAVEGVHSACERILSFVEAAIRRCGSASALARELGVSAATVSEWRSGRKRPGAIKLILIQDLALKE